MTLHYLQAFYITFETYPSCPSKTAVHAKVETLYILQVLSTLPVTKLVPIALKLKSKI